jgi:hypothetical protein
MSRTGFIFFLLFFIVSCPAIDYIRIYLDGYYPIINNQVDIFKINNGANLYKSKPYLVNNLGYVTTKKIDLDSMKVTLLPVVGDELIQPAIVMDFDKYVAGIKYKSFRSALLGDFLSIQQQTATQTGGLIKDITIDLPNIAIPKTLRRILGNKAGRLNLDGTQKITLTGTSTKRKIIPIYETNRSSRFDLKMQQETNLRMSGTIGEKISVNLKYNSNQDETFFDPNNINIKYTGDEDEMVQSIEAGNIALSLSGSRYISYSTTSQGLFGITSKMKIGALDLSLIASKEEGQKNSRTYIGQSQADSTIIYSKNYALRTFYYLEKPQNIYNLYSDSDSDIPAGWKNNAIKTFQGAWQIRYPDLLPKDGTVKVFLDDGDATNDNIFPVGDSVFTSENEYYIPHYEELIEGTDFVTNYNVGTIELLKPIDRRYTIAVKYTRNDDVLVPPNNNVLDGVLHLKVIRTRNQEYDPTNPFSCWDYQMRNVYSMGITNVKKDDFRLEVYTENADRTRNYNVPDSLSHPGIITYNDYLRLDNNGDGRVNGDDSSVNLASGYIIIPAIRPFFPLSDTLIYQEESESISFDEFKHFISVYGKIGRDILSLGQTGVLEGSVKVKVNGITQKENIDYLVDYDMGQITFLSVAGKDTDAKIEIDYEYRSGFAVASKSLAGIRADWNITDNAKIGGTIIYRSESVDEKRPKIGNENMQLFLADIDGSATFKPRFLTQWLNAVPLIKTDAESRISISGETAVTMPNISGDDQHKNEAFIDDMEGILDSYPLGLSFSSWVLGSKPWQTSLPKGRVNWYNPLNVRMNQVYDDTTLNDNEKDESITVLAMKLFPNAIQQPGISNWSYAGIMKYLGNQLDFSSKKYIELLVKVDKYGEIPPNITIHVDLGDINEDFYTDYGGLNILNSEDKNKDGDLSLQNPSEDTGLDGIQDGQPGDDPNDNAIAEDANADGDYPYKNGTENNRLLDTEDLDNNGVLNQLDRYITYSASVTELNPLQNPYLSDYIDKTKYLLLRIPLNDITESNIVNNSTSGVQPTLKKVSYVRIWAETDKTSRLLIASASVVGNKWEDFYIRNDNNSIIPQTTLNSLGSSFQSGIADNQKTSHYTSPRNSFYTEFNKPTLEQSLTISAENLNPGHKILLRQRLVDYYNLLSYRKLLFWVYPENSSTLPFFPDDSLDIIFRMGADSLNYYQVRQPLRIINYSTVNGKMNIDDWVELEYDLQDFSKIKDSLEVSQEFFENGAYFSYYGTPTLTNIREFQLGIRRKSSAASAYTGITYFNDIRVAEPYEDIGWANRISLNSVFADFSTLDIEYERKSENFNTNIQRGRTQNTTFSSVNALKISNKYFLDKFFPSTWGLKLPLNLERNYSISFPRYRANSDILRSSIIDPVDKEREKTENLSYSANLGISQVTKPKSAILEYTVNKMSLNLKASNTFANTATAKDTTLAWQGTYNYNVTIPDNFLSLPLSKSYRLKLIPGSFTNVFSLTASEPKSYNWENRDTLSSWFPRAQTYPTKLFSTDNGLTWPLTSDFTTTYRLITKRDLMQKKYYNDLNIGQEVEYSQEIGANYAPNFFPNIFTLSNSFSTRYLDNQRKYTEYVSGLQEITYLRDGNSTRTFRVNFSLQNQDLLTSLATKIHTAAQQPKAIKKKDDYKEDNKDKDKDNNDKTHSNIKENLDKESEIDWENMTDDEIKAKREELEKEKELLTEKDKEELLVDKKDEPALLDSTSTASRFNLTAGIIGLLSKVKNLTGTFQNGYAQVYTNKNNRPNYAFQLGLPYQVPTDYLDSRNNENTYTLSSGVFLTRNIDSSLNYSYSITQRFASASNQIVAVTFPDVSVTIVDLENLMGISKYLSNARLNSSYQYMLRQNGDINWIKPKQETKTWSFNPLASITANIAQKVQTSLSYTMSKSENVTDMISYNVIRTTNNQALSANLSYAFQSSKGIEIPFTKRKINIRNELTSSLGISYGKNYETTRGSGELQEDVNSSNIRISPSASYQFDQNIKGGLSSSYEITRDKKRDDRVRIFSLGIWVEINL